MLRTARRPLAVLVAVVAFAATLSACLGAPASTDQIVKVDSTTTADGWTFDFYRNLAYPCSISGDQTFVIGRRTGSSDTASAPLWVKMRGGGVGWFDADGNPMPSKGQKTENSFDTLVGFDDAGLTQKIEDSPAGFRILLVSMCSHDIYAGNNTPDPNNPNTTPDGKPRPTTGLVATKSAIQYTMDTYPTDHYFLHGTSAGGYGTFHVAWALQQQGIPPAGLVSDSGILNQDWALATAAQGICAGGSIPDDMASRLAILGRMDPDVANTNNQPDLLVSRGDLTVPILMIWNHNDQNGCSGTPTMQCPLRDGTTITMAAVDCRAEPMRRAIVDLPASRHSEAMGVCVEGGNTAIPCDRHVVTTLPHGVNTDPTQPADYEQHIYDWVMARLDDS